MGMIDISGQTFGRLVAIKRVETIRGQAAWLCQCSCGNKTIAPGHDLRRGSTKSCGCLAAELSSQRLKKHGMTKTRLFRIWTSMISRCGSKSNSAYENYGGRGIVVCNEWKNFKEFYDWSIRSGYQENLSIDRINNNKGYSPENCRWTTAKQQANNRRSTIFLTVDGVKKTISEWAELYGIKYDTIYCRLQDGWSDEEAVLTNVARRKKHV